VIVWVTGLSGSGKTTVGTLLWSLLREDRPATVLLDGDEMRRILGRDDQRGDYSTESRRFVTERYHEICRWLDAQGIDVVCCVIGMFPDILERNRETFSDYFEVFLDAPIELLIERDPKGLYRKAMAGEMPDVVGVDIPYPSPPTPDLRVPVSLTMPSPSAVAADIADRVRERT
jgi:adenylylsulfate kinase